MPVQLKELTRANWRSVVRLSVRDDQKGFVANNAYSIAQSKIEPELIPLAVYDGDKAVGFVLYGVDLDTGKFWIVRLMIDQILQGNGYGRAAMNALINLMQSNPDCKQIYISYEHNNEVARKLYLSLGFVETGEVEGNETVARLDLA